MTSAMGLFLVFKYEPVLYSSKHLRCRYPRKISLTFFSRFGGASDSITVSFSPSPVVSSPTKGSHPSGVWGVSYVRFLSDDVDCSSTSFDLEGKRPYPVVMLTS